MTSKGKKNQTPKELRRGRSVLPPLQDGLDINSNGFSSDVQVDRLSEDNRQIVDLMMGKLEDVKGEILVKLCEKDQRLDELELQVNSLKADVTELRGRLDDVEGSLRADALIISGSAVPDERGDENCVQVACHTLRTHLNHELRPEDIRASYRLGKKPLSQTPRKRSLYVKLNARDTRTSILLSCKRAKPPNLFVNEDLTPDR